MSSIALTTIQIDATNNITLTLLFFSTKGVSIVKRKRSDFLAWLVKEVLCSPAQTLSPKHKTCSKRYMSVLKVVFTRPRVVPCVPTNNQTLSVEIKDSFCLGPGLERLSFSPAKNLENKVQAISKQPFSSANKKLSL